VRAINHALTGAVIGLTVGQPLIALPLAFLSHFAQDAIPHHDFDGDEAARITSQAFMPLLLADVLLCMALVGVLGLLQPEQWFVAVIAAFLATSPDLMWLRMFLLARRHRPIAYTARWWERFHVRVQWRTGPALWVVEAAWLAVGSVLLWNLMS